MAEQTADSGAGAPAQSTQLAQAQGVNRTPAGAGFDFNDMASRVGDSLKRGDLGFAIGLVLIMVVLIMPLPAWLLDISLALSITLAVLILMTVVFIRKAMEFNAFPVVLLIATLLRLALNLATTRLILAHGHEGTAAAAKSYKKNQTSSAPWTVPRSSSAATPSPVSSSPPSTLSAA
jgi:flagellar biosynthesis protein FlhA